jgi:cation transport ATPase
MSPWYKTVKKYADGDWVDWPFEELKKGDKVRVYAAGQLHADGYVVTEPKPCEPVGNYELTLSDMSL